VSRTRAARKHRKRTITVICRDCHLQSELSAKQWYAASRARCPACGGTINRPRDMRGPKKKADGLAGAKSPPVGSTVRAMPASSEISPSGRHSKELALEVT
jgi:ribosomal protein S27E